MDRHAQNILRLYTECCVEGSHLQYVDAVAIRKITCVEYDYLETDMRSTSSGTDAIDRREVLRRPSAGIVQFSCDMA